VRWRSKSRLGVSVAETDDLPVLAGLLERRLPWFDGIPQRLHWTTVVRFERRTSSSYGRGRVWLAGDAAHLGGPLAIQSMNAGLREGSVIADCAASVIHGGAPLAMLEDYGAASQAAWSTVAEQPIAPFATAPASPERRQSA
jgi:2-polyprenyl-6-methoxyphenol hydroxylase-like FAD-dependent oxidoreductase